MIPGIEYIYFLHDRPWISPWIKSISNELDITIHVVAQLSGYCDFISNRLWRHQQNENRASETRGRCVKLVVFIGIYGFVMSCKIKQCMYSRHEPFLRSLECYFGIYFPRCFATRSWFVKATIAANHSRIVSFGMMALWVHSNVLRMGHKLRLCQKALICINPRWPPLAGLKF